VLEGRTGPFQVEGDQMTEAQLSHDSRQALREA
jgi:hypothetical protein